ncbi:MAG: tRNA (adenosine(37)-N6)-threonylcarbamoyltransferase complex ATPase subunit type 1 TsaE [Candidatus Sungbacteria bacterium]|nr:tRNA (adenosine(37)-N6)-threonylcarbamoyltransferase complex ATPase subunit type 1 TsaE [Candidatus Sungbacteria bacterium]
MRRGFHIVSKTQLRALAKNVLSRIARGWRAHLILLSGNLGSGKTTFVQMVAKQLGVRERVLSPTFVFVHEHEIFPKATRDKGHGTWAFKKLIHVDAYRIETKRDFDAIGLSRYTKDSENLVLIEWGERIQKWLPEPDLVVEFDHHRPHLRKVKVVSRIKK